MNEKVKDLMRVECMTCQRSWEEWRECRDFERKFENEIEGYRERGTRCWHPKGSIFVWGEEPL